MRKQIKSFISGLLAVVMLIASVNVPVFAETCDHVGKDTTAFGSISWNDPSIGCAGGGKRAVSCNGCGETVDGAYDSVEPTSHTWNKGVCSVCGIECNHSGEGVTYEDKTPTSHKKLYNTCKKEVVEDHNYNDGNCRDCGYTCGHPLEKRELSDTRWTGGDCTKGGVADEKCSICGKITASSKAISANNVHDWNRSIDESKCNVKGCTVNCKHTGTKTKDKNYTKLQHKEICDECEFWKPVDHTFENGKCSECSYVCLHDGTKTYEKIDRSKHKEICGYCVLANEVPHSFVNGKCSATGCEYTCDHKDDAGKDETVSYINITALQHTMVYGTCKKEVVESHIFVNHVCKCGADNYCKHPIDKYQYKKNDASTHNIICGVEDCGAIVSANQIHTYTKGICACGAIDPNCKHEGSKSNYYKDKTYHTYECDICGAVISTSKHDIYYQASSYEDNKHDEYCIDCGYVFKTEKCSWKVIKADDPDDIDEDEHEVECTKCGNIDWRSHSFGYEYKDNDKHKKSCGCGLSSEQSCDYDGNTCKKCGHDKGGSSSSSSSSSSGVVYYAPTDIEALRKAGTALARDVITLKVNGASYDIAAVEAPLRDMANQYFIGNILLTQLGYNVLTPTKTYKFSSYNYFAPAGQPQTIVWKNTGLKAGDVAYVVYWHPVKKTQLLPCVVAADGSATFTVPDINGAICTLVKCEKIDPPKTKKGKKK